MDTKLPQDIDSHLPEDPDAEGVAWASSVERHGESYEPSEGGGGSDAISTIGDLAREFGISVRAIRFYEDRGLLQPRRGGSGRAYGPRERLHLKMILKGKDLGFTLSEIRDILTARAAEAEAQDFETCNSANFGAIGMRPGGRGALDAMKLDLAMALRTEQIVAQIDHLERQRQALDDAILALREAHHRRVARDGGRALR